VKVPPFIVTFSTLGVASSVPLIITGANSISVVDPRYAVVGQGRLFGVPVPVFLLLLAALTAWFVLNWTRFGVHVYALGGNRAAARLAGVNVARTTIAVYAISGFCAGMGGLISSSRLMVGFPATGLGNELFFSIASASSAGSASSAASAASSGR
jgi:ribose transport system permease protein